MKKLMLVMFFFILYLQISCIGQIRKNLDSILSKHLSSQHFNYFMSEGDNVDTVLPEKYYDWLVSKLTIDVKEKINFYKFKDIKHMKETINIESNCFALGGTNIIYGVWQIDAYELVRSIVMKNVGISYQLFNEGIAVACKATLRDSVIVPAIKDEDFNLLSKYNYKNRKIPDLDTLLRLQSLQEIDKRITYPAAGSFINFLIDGYGIDKLKEFISKSHYEDKKNEFYNIFFSVYNLTLTKAWSDWLDFLNNYHNSVNYNKYYQDWIERPNKSINLNAILSKHLSTQHYNYFMSEGDNVDTVFQEKYYNWLVTELAIDVKEKINYYKFKDRKHLKELTGSNLSGSAIRGTNNIYGFGQTDTHESVHSIVMKYLGMPYALFNEGIAMAYTAVLRDSVFVPEASGADINLISKYNYKNGKMPDLDTLLGFQTLREIDDLITYSAAGSFTRFLINNYGIEKLKEFISKCHFEDKKIEVYNKFSLIYDMTLTNAWSDWLTYLDDYQNSIDYNNYFQNWIKRFHK